MDKAWKESFSVSDRGIWRIAFLNVGAGRRIAASGGGDGKLHLHDLDDVTRLAVELGAHKDFVLGMAVSERGGSGGCSPCGILLE